MTKCNMEQTEKSSLQLQFPFLKSKPVKLDFDGGNITSDAGLIWVRRIDELEGLCEKISRAIDDGRDRRYVKHSMLDLIRQRVYQICADYEDCNDADELRSDACLRAVAADREPGDTDLACQPTLSRLENRTDEYELDRIMRVFVDQYTNRRNAPPYIVLDIDPTDDTCHGNQQLSFFHGYYYEKIYHQLVIFDGETGELITPVLRAGNTHGADSVIDVFEWLLPQIREAWPETEIIIRADGGLAVPSLYEYLEEQGCHYVIGLITNDRLRDLNRRAMIEARNIFECEGNRDRVLCEFEYQANSWPFPRRVVGKAELLEKGSNQRFVVTDLNEGHPDAIYKFYRGRGEGAENRIKEWKSMMHADRLSCHGFYPNWFRMLLYSAAYSLMWAIKQKLEGTELARSTVDTIRLKLIKVGARVRSTARRLWFHCATGYPYKQIWLHLHAKLCAG